MTRNEKIGLYIIYLAVVGIGSFFLYDKIGDLLSMKSTVWNFIGAVAFPTLSVAIILFLINLYNSIFKNK